ncbi:MAG: hypothetical protein HUJ71_00500 [Pseudobutyrivibrio sp.]|nr:hypothetical protein [Pseudobutyrivibrio sp.]
MTIGRTNQAMLNTNILEGMKRTDGGGIDFAQIIGKEAKKNVPYSSLADENGVIEYNGVTFICDYGKNTLNLGDTSDKSKCLYIPLEKGGSLVVNRDNLGVLQNAIGMFSAADIGRILRAIAQDTRACAMEVEAEDSDALTDQEKLDKQAEAMYQKMINGEDVDVKFQIGASEMTLSEWDKLMERVDKDIDEAKETADSREEEINEVVES